MIQEAGGSNPPERVSGSGPLCRGSGVDDSVVAGSTPAGPTKFYVIARADLAVGLRTAQVGHALIQWVLEHGKPPDNLVVLQVPDEEALLDYADAACGMTLGTRGATSRYALFHEPDLKDDPRGWHTALAVGPEGWRWLSSLPLLR